MGTGTRVLTGRHGDSFTFDAGNFCLELLLTGGPGMYEVFEILHRPADLAEWLTESKLASEVPLRMADIRIRPADLRRIKHFRDTLRTVAIALAEGRQPAKADLEVINFSLGTPPARRIDPKTLTRVWATPVTGPQVLAAAAAEAVDLIAAAPNGRIRMCAADNCYLLFVDTSRPGNRRWCSMQRCGNRNKVHTYRAKDA